MLYYTSVWSEDVSSHLKGIISSILPPRRARVILNRHDQKSVLLQSFLYMVPTPSLVTVRSVTSEIKSYNRRTRLAIIRSFCIICAENLQKGLDEVSKVGL
jgi:hypothetical protein